MVALARAALFTALVAATLVPFSPLFQNGFVNWDDPDAIQRNPHLTEPGTLAWAFTTTHMSHYQPLSWVAWSALARRASGPAAFHALSLAGHLINLVLVAWLALRLLPRLNVQARTGAAVTAALIFGIHPLRVEPVAWASAFPYVLSTSFLLLATLAYITWLERRGAWLSVSVALYGLSILARPIAPALPIVLAVIDRCRMRSVELSSPRILSKLPFLALTVVGLVLEARARPLISLSDIGIGARLTAAVTAPFLYLWQTLAPLNLAPLRPLPLAARTDPLMLLIGGAGLVLVTLVCFRYRSQFPALPAGWLSYLVLLAPAVGLMPSGLQATADRYTYVPSVALALAVATLSAGVWRSRSYARVAAWSLAGVTLASGYGVWRHARWWHDSISLWSRAADLDPSNDVALYNLGVALAADGRDDEAAASYERILRLVPEHGAARRNLSLLEATRYQRQADGLAAAGRLGEAVDAYGQVLTRDPARALARAARGVAELQLGRIERAAIDLRQAWAAGVRDAPTANAFAFVLMRSGGEREAGTVLREALAVNPHDRDLASNLARLLATADDPAARDPDLALTLALQSNAATGGKDPRLLDTLAAAYARTGDLARGLDASRRAAAAARSAGDREMAARIEANWASYAAFGARQRTPARTAR